MNYCSSGVILCVQKTRTFADMCSRNLPLAVHWGGLGFGAELAFLKASSRQNWSTALYCRVGSVREEKDVSNKQERRIERNESSWPNQQSRRYMPRGGEQRTGSIIWGGKGCAWVSCVNPTRDNNAKIKREVEREVECHILHELELNAFFWNERISTCLRAFFSLKAFMLSDEEVACQDGVFMWVGFRRRRVCLC